MLEICLPLAGEKNETFVGDSWVPKPLFSSLHGITINALPADVWPWIVQIGQGRAGFYSYTFLENLLGCRMRNAEQVMPQWQNLAVGDPIHLHPRFPPLKVVQLEREQSLVLYQEGWAVWSWAFSLRMTKNPKVGSQATRLLVRTRLTSNTQRRVHWFRPAMKFGHYIMERQMLTGIKRRIEQNRQSKMK